MKFFKIREGKKVFWKYFLNSKIIFFDEKKKFRNFLNHYIDVKFSEESIFRILRWFHRLWPELRAFEVKKTLKNLIIWGFTSKSTSKMCHVLGTGTQNWTKTFLSDVVTFLSDVATLKFWVFWKVDSQY